ncbi:MAG: hypothetical protein ACI8PZ_003731 [Myxococcota bacterium]|jgi:hypothetical protein
MLTLLLVGLAFAGPAPAESPPEATTPNHGEYVRISQEIEKLAMKNAWTGVNRLWPDLLATGVPLGLDELLAGAHAARALGDVDSSHIRLDSARTLVTDDSTERQIIEWLSEIDTHYGRVSLKCDKQKQEASLEVVAMPFKPDMQLAIRYATEQVATVCDFEGMLPAGAYVFVVDDTRAEIRVEPQVSSVQIDLRRHDPKRKKR